MRFFLGISILAISLSACISSGQWFDSTAKYRYERNIKANVGYVIAQGGESYYQLASRHKVDLRYLLEANNAKPPYKLVAGTKLRLPPERRIHIVHKEDTLYSLSQQYQMNIRHIVKLNKIKYPYQIKLGQELIVKNILPKKSLSIAKKEGIAKTTPTLAGSFIWPAKGKIISPFGAKGDGIHNDGINISLPIGTPIRASENAIVLYAGNALKGYGKLLLLRHANGYITAYAHNSKLLVNPGQNVQQGQVIAHSGKSGNVGSGQLHFEIRKGSQAIDPKDLI